MAKIEITKASEVNVREIEWLWYPYIPFGKVTVLQGDAGDGKSTFLIFPSTLSSESKAACFDTFKKLFFGFFASTTFRYWHLPVA